MALLTLIAVVECGEPDGNSNALNGEAIVKEKLYIVIWNRKDRGSPSRIGLIQFGFTYYIPGVGEDAAPADSHGLAVVSMSIGATSEGCE